MIFPTLGAQSEIRDQPKPNEARYNDTICCPYKKTSLGMYHSRFVNFRHLWPTWGHPVPGNMLNHQRSPKFGGRSLRHVYNLYKHISTHTYHLHTGNSLWRTHLLPPPPHPRLLRRALTALPKTLWQGGNRSYGLLLSPPHH